MKLRNSESELLEIVFIYNTFPIRMQWIFEKIGKSFQSTHPLFKLKSAHNPFQFPFRFDSLPKRKYELNSAKIIDRSHVLGIIILSGIDHKNFLVIYTG